ncbi:bifunctional folylpolyglutamate synthase/dihydrofolate synthase [Membranihabitans marinus]|uniref:bifunctional folylpolyglutamate synthase/dihydrofolate synthase n=1 Tax=Membranihabitans marinus TaxID=1227546 RepID=UPI001F2CC27C|nr:folylpolyglutamate synthase/dihydrofolate synthase family protein [Membranihabitans marinus]
MTKLNYQEAEEFIMSALPMFQKLGRPSLEKLDLRKTLDFMSYLGNPHKDLKCIHIAGTNGKGSVSHMLSGIFQQNGYDVGLFTSPHLRDYRERIKINGIYIDKDYIADWVSVHQQYLSDAMLSFFEMSTGLAFDYFKEKKIDLAIIETGLGGRLDSTNVIHPLLSIITSIDFDHMDILGHTLKEIAGEKAGIIKPEVPVLLGNVNSDLEVVFEEKARNENSIIFKSDLSLCQFRGIVDFKRSYRLINHNWGQDGLLLDNLGPYQDHNVNTCLHAIKIVQSLGLIAIDIGKSLAGLARFSQLSKFKGRFEIVSKQPLIIADAAHNAAGIQYLKEYFDKKSLHLHIVFGMVEGKDHSSVLSQLPKDATYYFCNMSIPRAMSAEKIQQLALNYQLSGKVYKSANEALTEIKQTIASTDTVLVFGSIFLIAEIL